MRIARTRHRVDGPGEILVLDRGNQFPGEVILDGNQGELFRGGHGIYSNSRLRVYRKPANSWSRCQFSSRSCFAQSSNSDGLPSLSKCLEKRPSLRAKSMKLTSSLVLGFLNQSSLTAGLPW